MNYHEINNTEWYHLKELYPSGSSFEEIYKYSFTKKKKFHMKPTIINNKLYWFKHSYYIERVTAIHIVVILDDRGKYPQTETVQVRQKDYESATSAKDLWLIYEKLKGIVRV